MKNKLDQKTKVLRKKLVIVPPIMIPMMGFFFYAQGGGTANDLDNNVKEGFNTELPKSAEMDIVESKQAAYENEQSSYMSKFDLEELPEMTSTIEPQLLTENSASSRVPSLKHDPNADILSMYEDHSRTLNNNRQGISRTYDPNPTPVTRSNPTIKKLETSSGNVIYDVVEEQPQIVNQEQPKRSLFNDNLGSANNNTKTNKAQQSITAVIHGDQTVATSGNTQSTRIKFRTTKAVNIDGVEVPVNTIIYGNGSYNNGRLNVSIANIQIKNKIVPLALQTYDATDANLGIRLSSSTTQDAQARETLESDGVRATTSAVGATGVVGSVVSSVGNVASNIFRQKGANKEVDLISNYKVILK